MGRVQDRVVIVTGGAGGIGAAACRAIAAEGGEGRRRRPRRGRRRGPSPTRSSPSGGTAESVGVDVTDRSQVQAMIRKAVDAFGELNVIFNNAGMNRPRDFMEVDEANFERDRPRQHLGRDRLHAGGREADDRAGLRRQDRQHRVDREPPGLLGLRPLLRREVRRRSPITQATARGLIEHGITVNAFAPGVVDTPMWVGLNEDIRAIHGQSDDDEPDARVRDGNAHRPPRRTRPSWRRSWSTWPRPSPTT